jgi:thioredoxin 1
MEANSETFDLEVISSPVPVLVDFWAPWCGPCRVVSSSLREIAATYKGRAKVVRVNTDLNQELASRYQVRNLPTVMVVAGGQVVTTTVGVRPKEEYMRLLDQTLGSGS